MAMSVRVIPPLTFENNKLMIKKIDLDGAFGVFVDALLVTEEEDSRDFHCDAYVDGEVQRVAVKISEIARVLGLGCDELQRVAPHPIIESVIFQDGIENMHCFLETRRIILDDDDMKLYIIFRSQ